MFNRREQSSTPRRSKIPIPSGSRRSSNATSNATSRAPSSAMSWSQQGALTEPALDAAEFTPIHTFSPILDVLKYHSAVDPLIGQGSEQNWSQIQDFSNPNDAKGLVSRGVSSMLRHRRDAAANPEAITTLAETIRTIPTLALLVIPDDPRAHFSDPTKQLLRDAADLPKRFEDLVTTLSSAIDGAESHSVPIRRKDLLAMLEEGTVISCHYDAQDHALRRCAEKKIELEEALSEVCSRLGAHRPEKLSVAPEAPGPAVTSARGSQAATTTKKAFKPIRSFSLLLEIMAIHSASNTAPWTDISSALMTINNLHDVRSVRRLVQSGVDDMMSSTSKPDKPAGAIAALGDATIRLLESTKAHIDEGNDETLRTHDTALGLQRDYLTAIGSLSNALDSDRPQSGTARFTREMLTSLFDEKRMLLPVCNTADDAQLIENLMKDLGTYEESLLAVSKGLRVHLSAIQ